MKTLLVAIHGILTNQTDASWPDKLDAWMFTRDPSVKVLKKEYAAGPFPHWNCWIKDPALAHSLANELELFLQPDHGSPSPPLEERDGERRPFSRQRVPHQSINPPIHQSAPPALWFVAHSNGAVIALLTAQILIARGYTIAGIILTGAAVEADICKNHIFAWYCELSLRAAIAYSSADDQVLNGDSRTATAFRSKIRSWLWGTFMQPYGCLGRTGWLNGGKPLNPELKCLFTRWTPGGHSTYFLKDNIQSTFEQIYHDITAVS